MTEKLPTTNATASFANRTLVQILNDLIPVAEAAIIASEPFMATPVLKEVWEEIFEVFVKELTQALGTGAGYIAIDIQSYMNLVTAAKALAAIQAAKQSGDSHAIAQASAAADAAVAPILHYVGDVKP